MESLGNCWTHHGPWWSLSVTALKDGQVFQMLAAHNCASTAEFCIHIKALGISQTAFPNILSPSDQNQWGASVSNCYPSTASKLLFLKVAFQRVFIPIAREDKALIFLPRGCGWSQNLSQLFIMKQLVWFPDPKKKKISDAFFSVSICLKRWLCVASMASAQTCICSGLSDQAINFSACGSTKLL